MGKHLILEVYDVNYDLLNTINPLADVMEEGIQRAKMTILNKFTHQFEPHGLTLIFSLAESHVSVHTFPEMNSLTADAYTCGEGNPRIIIVKLLQYFNSENYRLRELSR